MSVAFDLIQQLSNLSHLSPALHLQLSKLSRHVVAMPHHHLSLGVGPEEIGLEDAANDEDSDDEDDGEADAEAAEHARHKVLETAKVDNEIFTSLLELGMHSFCAPTHHEK